MDNTDLFKKYERSFHELNAEGMIEMKKEWAARNPGVPFYQEYTKFVLAYVPVTESPPSTNPETPQTQDCKEDSCCSTPNNSTLDA
jgi:hypothetical protein